MGKIFSIRYYNNEEVSDRYCYKKSMFFNHGNNDSLLNSKESSQLNTWLLKPNKATPNFTNWQVLANMWNAIPNARFTVDLNKQPDYSTIYPYK